jgi:sporulation protein YlmC with PRC-barrel domain
VIEARLRAKRNGRRAMTDIRANTSQDPQSVGTAILGGGPPSLAPGPEVMAAHALRGDPVVNPKVYALGRVEHIVLDVQRGRVAYAVLSFGGFLGLGEKLFAIPWSALTFDADRHRFILNIDRGVLEGAPGFDKSQWPPMADPAWASHLHAYYGYRPYWS